MLGIVIAALSNAFRELSDTIGKKEMRAREIGYFSYGFLTLFFGALFLIGYGLWFDDFRFSFASLPTFVPRVFLEVLQTYVMVVAIASAERSDFGLVRVLTLPLLLGVDVWLGYSIDTYQWVGIAIIIAAVLFLILSEGLRKRGLVWILIGAVNAVATISLFKYNITYFNSVAAEESIVTVILLIVFWAGAMYFERTNPFIYLRRPIFAIQSGAAGVASGISPFAFMFAPAGVIVAALRGSAILFGILTGKMYFREKHFIFKLSLFFVILGGLVLLAMGS